MSNKKEETKRNTQKSDQSAGLDMEFELGITREGMTDEDYISALEYKLGTKIAELNSCSSLMQRLDRKSVV